MLTTRARSQTTFHLVWGILWRLVAIGLAVYVVWRVRFILVIVLLSIIVTFVVHPLVNRACQWRPRWIPRASWRFIATLTVFLVLMVMSVGMTLWVWAPFQGQLNDLHRSMGEYQRQIQAHLEVIQAWYRRLPESMRQAIVGEPVASLTQYLFGVVRKIIESTLNWVTHVWELLLIPVLAFYFCLDSRSLKRELLFLVPYSRVREALYIVRYTGRVMQSYVVAQLVLCVVAGVTVGVGLWALKVPYPLVLGVLAGITRAVPIVGPVVSGIPITLLALTISLNLGVSVLVFFCILHLVESKILLPQLVGHSINLHPAIILIVLLIGAEFFGILGMFLAAPVAAIVRMLLNLYLVAPEVRRRKGVVPPEPEEDLPAQEVEDGLRRVG